MSRTYLLRVVLSMGRRISSSCRMGVNDCFLSSAPSSDHSRTHCQEEKGRDAHHEAQDRHREWGTGQVDASTGGEVCGASWLMHQLVVRSVGPHGGFIMCRADLRCGGWT